MPRIFEDATLTLPNGDVYLFEDLDRLRLDGQKPKAQAAKQSMNQMLQYIFKVYPGFNPCKSTESSCEEDEFIKEEARKVERAFSNGTPRPTPQQWRDRVDETVAEIKGRHGKDIEPAFFRISKDRQHVGALFLNEIRVLSITPEGVRRLSVNASLAIDEAEDNNNLWQRLYGRLGLGMMLTTSFLNMRNDSRVFKIVRVEVPDIYEGVKTKVNKTLLDILKADSRFSIQLYGTNSAEQDQIGIERVRSVTRL